MKYLSLHARTGRLKKNTVNGISVRNIGSYVLKTLRLSKELDTRRMVDKYRIISLSSPVPGPVEQIDLILSPPLEHHTSLHGGQGGGVTGVFLSPCF